VEELLLFDLRASIFQRVKVTGQLLVDHNGEYFLMQQTNGLRFMPRQTNGLRPGDLVDVAGFPDLGGPSPILREALARRTGYASLPAPRRLKPEDLVEARFDSTLVTLQAVLVSSRVTRGELVLELQSGLRRFVARLQGHDRAAETLPAGCRLELTGVYVALGGNPALPRGIDSLELLLLSAKDIRVLAQPPWWTLQRLLSVLGVMSGILAAAMLWVFTLKRRVNVQTQLIRQKVQGEATLEERARIARELHDTLEQALAGVGLQLNALSGMLREIPAEPLRILSVACSMVRHGQEEARRTVRNLRLLALEKADLPGALAQIASLPGQSGAVRIEVRVSGDPLPLPAPVESHLLRIGQEATANALKHARPDSIRLDLQYAPDSVQLRISDDGCGFDADRATPGEAGHFGLLGMRERVEKIGGALRILSSPGSGTTIQVLVHLPYRGPDERFRLRTGGETGPSRSR
jgi:signal transduction histidine kinase